MNYNDYINKQKYIECMVVTALNAYTYLTGEKIEQESEQYEYLVDLAECRHRGAEPENLEKVYKKLGLKVIKEYKNYLDIHANFIPNSEEDPLPFKIVDKKVELPIEVMINNHPKHSKHSLLIVDYEPKTEAYQIVGNFEDTTSDGWVFKENFLVHVNEHLFPMWWSYRQIGLM